MHLARAERRGAPAARKRLPIVLAALLAALALFFALLARTLSLGHAIDGLRQPGGQVRAGALPGLDWPERWMEPREGELTFWACAGARFAHGYATGTLRFENPQASPYTLVFEISAPIGGKAVRVYRSPPLPPGACLEGGKLSRPLKQGEYSGVCVAYAYLPGERRPCARAQEQPIAITVLQ